MGSNKKKQGEKLSIRILIEYYQSKSFLIIHIWKQIKLNRFMEKKKRFEDQSRVFCYQSLKVSSIRYIRK